MVFYFLILIVFIAELIVFAAIMFQLAKFNRFCIKTNEFLNEAKPKIEDIFKLAHGISDQIYELIPIWLQNIKNAGNKLIQKQVESLISGLLFWGINIKILKKLRKNKIVKVAFKGLTLIQNVI